MHVRLREVVVGHPIHRDVVLGERDVWHLVHHGAARKHPLDPAHKDGVVTELGLDRSIGRDVGGVRLVE